MWLGLIYCTLTLEAMVLMSGYLIMLRRRPEMLVCFTVALATVQM